MPKASYGSKPWTYRIYWNKRPGRLLINFWTLGVAAYSRWALIKFLLFSAAHFQNDITKQNLNYVWMFQSQYIVERMGFIRGWALINFYRLQGGRIFENVCLND